VFWLIAGIALLIWVVHDLVVGSVWSYRKIHRKNEPLMYWVVLIMWFIVAILCMTPYLLYYWFI